ncbi:hypothetical protein HYQ46_004135 [Verticillium longisporum]|nr:hypothetical protein HYQ46_004135 [Verticillium longisporum]
MQLDGLVGNLLLLGDLAASLALSPRAPEATLAADTDGSAEGITLLDLDGILRCEHEALEEHLGRVGFGGALLGEEILEDNGRLAALLVVVLSVGAEEVAKNVYGMLGAERHRPAVLRVDDGGDSVVESGYRVTLNLAGLAIIITHLEAHVVVIGSNLEDRAVIGHDARSARRLGCSVVIVALHVSNPAVAFPLELWRASRSERQQAPQFRSPGRTTTVEQDVGDEPTALLHVNQGQNKGIPWQEGLGLQDVVAIRLLFLDSIAGKHETDLVLRLARRGPRSAIERLPRSVSQ